MALPALAPDVLEALGPGALVSWRIERYAGDGTDITLAELTPVGVVCLQRLYDALLRAHATLLAALGPARGDEVAALAALAALAHASWWRDAIDGAAAVEPRRAGDARARRAVHEVRSGALPALAAAAEFAARGMPEPGEATRAAMLARDHLKILRNVVRDLDEARRIADLAGHRHDVAMLVEKWADAIHRTAPDRRVAVRIDAHWQGAVSMQCLEFAALDRVVYNLANNAARFTTDGEVRLAIAALAPGDARPADAPDLRLVVANTVEPAHAARLVAHTGGALRDLFRGGFTTGGTGLGLAICAELVANAYGTSAERAIDEGYVGMTLEGTRVLAWAHWPALA